MKEKNEFPIAIVMTTFIIILLMYLFTYSQGMKWFWLFFIIERLLNLNYAEHLETYFFRLEEEDVKGGQLILTIIFSVLSIGILLYTPFKYPGLFFILMAGEIIDFVVKGIKKKIKLK